tara:strand:+ start:1101 stop:1214 length:114 start_codon:yes stop_codon:yes gene_type:complete
VGTAATPGIATTAGVARIYYVTVGAIAANSGATIVVI